MPSGNFTKQWIFINCGNCKKEIKLTQGNYNSRIKRVKNGILYCSNECRQIAHNQEDIRDKQLICKYCNKDFTNDLHKYDYNKRKKKDIVFCSEKCSVTFRNKSEESRKNNSEKQLYVSCPQRGRIGHEVSEETKEKLSNIKTTGNSNILYLKCNRCSKEFQRQRWIHNMLMKKSSTGNIFCSNRCASTGREMSEETKEKIKTSQLGISKPQSGVIGHIVNEETRLKMSLNRTGINSTADWNIVLQELKSRGITKYSLTKRPIPDAIWINENYELCALELEKKPWFASVKKKMDMYISLDLQHHMAYDKVYLVWYTPNGKRQGEWIFEKNKRRWSSLSI